MLLQFDHKCTAKLTQVTLNFIPEFFSVPGKCFFFKGVKRILVTVSLIGSERQEFQASISSSNEFLGGTGYHRAF